MGRLSLYRNESIASHYEEDPEPRVKRAWIKRKTALILAGCVAAVGLSFCLFRGFVRSAKQVQPVLQEEPPGQFVAPEENEQIEARLWLAEQSYANSPRLTPYKALTRALLEIPLILYERVKVDDPCNLYFELHGVDQEQMSELMKKVSTDFKHKDLTAIVLIGDVRTLVILNVFIPQTTGLRANLLRLGYESAVTGGYFDFSTHDHRWRLVDMFSVIQRWKMVEDRLIVRSTSRYFSPVAVPVVKLLIEDISRSLRLKQPFATQTENDSTKVVGNPETEENSMESLSIYP